MTESDICWWPSSALLRRRPCLLRGKRRIDRESPGQSFERIETHEQLQFDAESKTHNKTVNDLFQKREVNLFTSENDAIRCALAERFIATLKFEDFSSFSKWFATRYVDKIPDLVYALKHSVYRSHWMGSVEVLQQNSLILSQNSIDSVLTTMRFKSSGSVLPTDHPVQARDGRN